MLRNPHLLSEPKQDYSATLSPLHSPVRSPGRSPVRSPGRSRGRSPGRSPVQSPGHSLFHSLVRSFGRSPSRSPIRNQSDSFSRMSLSAFIRNMKQLNQESPSLFNPRELQLQFRLLTVLFLLAETGAGVGMGLSFLDLATLSQDEATQLLMSGSVLTYAAYGTLVAVGLGFTIEVVLPFLDYLGSLYLYKGARCARPKQDYGAAEHRMERVRVCYRISPSRLLVWYFRVFLAGEACGFLGESLLSYVLQRNSYPAMVGELAGYGLGVLIGAILGLMTPPLLGRFLTRYFSGDPAQPIQERVWYRECRHEVVWYLRLFIGASIGRVGFSLFSDPWTDENFTLNRLRSVTATAVAVWASPFLFAFHRLIKRKLGGQQEPTAVRAEFRRSASWSAASPIEMPWYVRLFFAVLMMITLYDVLFLQITRSHRIGLITASALLVSAPLLSSLTRTVCNRVGLQKASAQLENGPVIDLNISRDLPWYVRGFFGLLTGCLLADVLYYYQNEPVSEESWSTVFVLTLLALFSPLFRVAVGKIGVVEENARDYSLPWYLDLGAALLLGASLGTALGRLFPQWVQEESFVFGYIGPDWLGFSNEPLAATGGLIASGAYFLQILAYWSWSHCRRQKKQPPKEESPAFPFPQKILEAQSNRLSDRCSVESSSEEEQDGSSFSLGPSLGAVLQTTSSME